MTSRDHSAHTAAGDDPLCRDRHQGSPVSARGRDFPKVIHSTKGTGGQPPASPTCRDCSYLSPFVPAPAAGAGRPEKGCIWCWVASPSSSLSWT